MVITNFTNGTNVVTEGEKGDEFFIISAGDAEVWRDGALVCPLKRGDYFGEVGQTVQYHKCVAICPPSVRPLMFCIMFCATSYLVLLFVSRC